MQNKLHFRGSHISPLTEPCINSLHYCHVEHRPLFITFFTRLRISLRQDFRRDGETLLGEISVIALPSNVNITKKWGLDRTLTAQLSRTGSSNQRGHTVCVYRSGALSRPRQINRHRAHRLKCWFTLCRLFITMKIHNERHNNTTVSLQLDAEPVNTKVRGRKEKRNKLLQPV